MFLVLWIFILEWDGGWLFFFVFFQESFQDMNQLVLLKVCCAEMVPRC